MILNKGKFDNKEPPTQTSDSYTTIKKLLMREGKEERSLQEGGGGVRY